MRIGPYALSSQEALVLLGHGSPPDARAVTPWRVVVIGWRDVDLEVATFDRTGVEDHRLPAVVESPRSTATSSTSTVGGKRRSTRLPNAMWPIRWPARDPRRTRRRVDSTGERAGDEGHLGVAFGGVRRGKVRRVRLEASVDPLVSIGLLREGGSVCTGDVFDVHDAGGDRGADDVDVPDVHEDAEANPVAFLP